MRVACGPTEGDVAPVPYSGETVCGAQRLDHRQPKIFLELSKGMHYFKNISLVFFVPDPNAWEFSLYFYT